jgi:hypothetical protein
MRPIVRGLFTLQDGILFTRGIGPRRRKTIFAAFVKRTMSVAVRIAPFPGHNVPLVQL